LPIPPQAALPVRVYKHTFIINLPSASFFSLITRALRPAATAKPRPALAANETDRKILLKSNANPLIIIENSKS